MGKKNKKPLRELDLTENKSAKPVVTQISEQKKEPKKQQITSKAPQTSPKSVTQEAFPTFQQKSKPLKEPKVEEKTVVIKEVATEFNLDILEDSLKNLTIDIPKPIVSKESTKTKPPKKVNTSKMVQENSGKNGNGGAPNGNENKMVVPARPTFKVNTGMRPPKRVGYGSVGRPISLRANHVKINVALNNLYHYDIDITPNKLPKSINRILFEYIKDQSKDTYFKNNCAAFDGSKNFYTVRPLPINRGEDLILNGTFPFEDRKIDYKVKIQFAAEVNMFQLEEFWSGRLSEISQDPVQAIDVIMKHTPSLRYVPVGRSLYPYPTNPPNLFEGCELWMGRFQSARPTQWKMTLNIDLAATAFYKQISIVNFAQEFLNLRQINSLSPHQKSMLQKELKNLKVRVTHQGHIQRTYVIREISNLSAAQQMFTMSRDGKETKVSVAEYFKLQYNKSLQYPNLPCLRVGSLQKQVYLPFEVCELKAGQKKNRVTDTMVANMIRHTAIPAPERERSIMGKIHDAKFNQDPVMKAFGISVDDKLIELQGRVLEAPKICYASDVKQREKTIIPSRGVWDMRQGEKFLRGAQIDRWALLILESMNRCNDQALSAFFKGLCNTGASMNLHLNPIPTFRTYANERDLDELFDHLKKRVEPEKGALQLVIVILPGMGGGRTSPLYPRIKRLGDVVYGFMTQCIQSKNVQRSSPALLVNLCLKINAKCDGINDNVIYPMKMALFKEPVIVLGADVTHPMPGDNKMPSIAAVVGSMDHYPQKYMACVKAQGHRVEIIENLSEMITLLLRRFYHQNNGAKPTKIIFYRDGVSEGQFLQVLQYEVAAIQAACTKIEAGYQPLITFAVVQKRHHTRLFCTDSRDQCGKSGNVPPGTIVDKGIVHPIENDFFLCSHAGIQGTSRPTHYHLLWDDNKLSADEFQALTYALCHSYVRCNRTVSIPAPAYYAHHVAFRARHHLAEEMHSSDGASVSGSSSAQNINLDKINRDISINPQTLSRMYFA